MKKIITLVAFILFLTPVLLHAQTYHIRAGATGNAISLLSNHTLGDGTVQANDYNHSTSLAAKLDIEYSY